MIDRLFRSSEQLLDFLDRHSLLIVLLLLAMLFVLERIVVALERRREESGLSSINAKAIGVDGSSLLPAREYISEIQGLAGRPDAVIFENDAYIPVERKPLANKLRDRHVAQLLVYMRLIEEFEGKRPPYGYLILGRNFRRIKIENSPERQEWLQKIIDEMRGIIDGAEAVAAPHPKKCSNCAVREHCPARADT